jgi:hypothetical protein
MRFSSASTRQEALDFLLANGVTEIRGVPIGERLVMSSDWHTALAAAKARLKKEMDAL